MLVPPELEHLPRRLVYDDQWFTHGYALDLEARVVVEFHVDRKDQHDSTREHTLEAFVALDTSNPKLQAVQAWVAERAGVGVVSTEKEEGA